VSRGINHGQLPQDARAVSSLSPEQYRVTQQSGTDARNGEYLENKEPGIYVDIVSGERLFASSDKFESGCGWPSFTKPIEPANVNELRDKSYGMIAPKCDRRMATAIWPRLPDGHGTAAALRYCINSASLRFIHRDDMKAEGYGDYLDQVEDI